MVVAWQIEEMDADYDPDFLRHIYPRLEWPALREAAQVMGKPLLLISNQQLTHSVAVGQAQRCLKRERRVQAALS